MTEQNLAVLLKEFAEELKGYRAELVALVPEAEERCGPLDELAEYIERQSHAFEHTKVVPLS